MALVVKDRVQETTTTTGTGTVTLAGAVSGFQSFSAIGNGNTTYYAIVGTTEWELGIGTYTSSGTTLSRDTVLSSSNSGSLVNFSAGAKNVFCTYSAVKAVGYDTPSSSTGSLSLPVGSTGDRPTGATGMVRFNTTTGEPEWYDPAGAQWLGFYKGPNYSIEYLVVAGGAGGGGYTGGGGGAGGLISASTTAISGVSYTVTIGAPGSGGSGSNRGTSGSNSVFDIVTAIGGGAGAQNDVSGLSGGSGGGGGHAPGGTGGAGTAGQGYAGGAGAGAPLYGGGGGGGATAVGASGQGGGTGNGGAGSDWLGLGTSYAGGGGGGIYNSGTTPGQGGAGGGGNGGNSSIGPQNGSTNRGGGGGGSGNNGPLGGNGGSGIVIVRYSGAQRGTGGTVTQSGGYTYHTFTSSGNYIA